MLRLHRKLVDTSRRQQLRLPGLHLHVDLLQLNVSQRLSILPGLAPPLQSEDDEGQEESGSQDGSSGKAKSPGLHTEALREAGPAHVDCLVDGRLEAAGGIALDHQQVLALILVDGEVDTLPVGDADVGHTDNLVPVKPGSPGQNLATLVLPAGGGAVGGEAGDSPQQEGVMTIGQQLVVT